MRNGSSQSHGDLIKIQLLLGFDFEEWIQLLKQQKHTPLSK